MALVTGAASGIGRAIAHTFVTEGCRRLILADVNGEGLETVAGELKALDSEVQTCVVRCDVSIEEDVARMVDQGVKAFGAIHYAVNNAGVSSKPRLRTHELEVESYDRVQNINLRGVWLCERAQLRQMLKQGTDLKMRSGSHSHPTQPLIQSNECDFTCRTGAPPQRGAIVNISSIFGRVSHQNVGAVGLYSIPEGVYGLIIASSTAQVNLASWVFREQMQWLMEKMEFASTLFAQGLSKRPVCDPTTTLYAFVGC